MNGYDYEACPQGISFVDSELNANYLFLYDYISLCLRTKRSIKILEIGTGGGRNLQALHRRFPDKTELFGTDISTAALSYAASLKIGTFSLEKSDTIPFDEKFDLILMIDILEHLDSSEIVAKTLDNARRYLSEGGCIYISVPTELNRFSLTWLFSKFFFFRDLTKIFYGHLIQFSPKSFRELIDTNKFAVKENFYSVHFLNQVQILFFFYIPKILISLFLGKRLANNLRDSNEIVKKRGYGLLSVAKKMFVSLSFPLAYLGFRESCMRRNSCFAAGNLHLLLASKL